MGFLKNIVHSLNSLNPVYQAKHPGRAIGQVFRNSADPGGSVIRAGRGVKQDLNNTFDPLNATLAAPPKPPTPYQGPGAGRGMYMGAMGPTLNLPNNTSRVYATNQFGGTNQPPPPMMGGGGGGGGGMGLPPQIPSPAPPPPQPPKPIMGGPQPMGKISIPELGQQQNLINALRGRVFQ